MPYEFTPEERIANILHVIKALDTLMHEADSRIQDMYQDQIKTHLINLNEAISDMKGAEEIKPTPPLEEDERFV
jgi:hypothetical protein